MNLPTIALTVLVTLAAAQAVAKCGSCDQNEKHCDKGSCKYNPHR